jgi:hypothetical protein
MRRRSGSSTLHGPGPNQTWLGCRASGARAVSGRKDRDDGRQTTRALADCDKVLIPRRSERTATMVPGMTERERLIRDMQRLEWLCDVALGPARSTRQRPARFGSLAGLLRTLIVKEHWWRGQQNRIRFPSARFVRVVARVRDALVHERSCESFSWSLRAMAGRLGNVQPARDRARPAREAVSTLP